MKKVLFSALCLGFLGLVVGCDSKKPMVAVSRPDSFSSQVEPPEVVPQPPKK